jgi:DNA-binding response OmpR family regulator
MKARAILVVEDDPVIAGFLADMLVVLGHGVGAVAGSEAAAVIAAARNRPDLMIVDVRLGDGSGILAVEAILRAGFIPHIFISGDRLRASDLHPKALALQKPFRQRDLVAAIHAVMAPCPNRSNGLRPRMA